MFQQFFWSFSSLTWFLSDIRKSKCAPGRPNSKYVLTRRRSAALPSRPWTHMIRCAPSGEKSRYSSLMWKYGRVEAKVE